MEASVVRGMWQCPTARRTQELLRRLAQLHATCPPVVDLVLMVQLLHQPLDELDFATDAQAQADLPQRNRFEWLGVIIVPQQAEVSATTSSAQIGESVALMATERSDGGRSYGTSWLDMIACAAAATSIESKTSSSASRRSKAKS
eukprot:CAMPEP_0170434022 /NCGR_PEP_ID=MMETSP0117_2-20130122/42817_1 /TAXON_ID=400756 /ORGANISM="Durinskia baltica, Strain CSIRO CS-38" /LENGTH=144 /DNA_ID=CAMNT_0010693825 /DNA_START=296 /DNA_END=727 /DNA_ORIENTATION=+